LDFGFETVDQVDVQDVSNTGIIVIVISLAGLVWLEGSSLA